MRQVIVVVGTDLINNPDVSDRTFRVFALIAARMKSDDWPDTATIAAQLDVSYATADRHVRSLVAAGALK